ncbi:MAG TPA: RNA polymerase sigma factor [Steroidobacteraceae bacterium]|nr:RNA polymerase sigma factor [Steroidobacteraceae bacterium]
MTRDTDLLALLERRDYDAVIEALMQRYGQKALNLAFSMVRDRSLAEDLAQVSFVKLWQALPRYDGRAQLSSLLYIITRNTCLSELRKRGRTVSLDALTSADDDDAAPLALPEDVDHAARAGAAYDAEKLLAALPENYRQVVSLFYLEDCSVEEVAGMLDMPVNTVKSLLHRGRKRLAAVAVPMEKAS